MLNDNKMLWDASLFISRLRKIALGAASLIYGGVACFVLDATKFVSIISFQVQLYQ